MPGHDGAVVLHRGLARGRVRQFARHARGGPGSFGFGGMRISLASLPSTSPPSTVISARRTSRRVSREEVSRRRRPSSAVEPARERPAQLGHRRRLRPAGQAGERQVVGLRPLHRLGSLGDRDGVARAVGDVRRTVRPRTADAGQQVRRTARGGFFPFGTKPWAATAMNADSPDERPQVRLPLGRLLAGRLEHLGHLRDQLLVVLAVPRLLELELLVERCASSPSRYGRIATRQLSPSCPSGPTIPAGRPPIALS